MSNIQRVDIGDRNSKYTRKSKNRNSEGKRGGKGPLMGVCYLTIIQYNCGNANHRLARPLLDSLDLKKYHILTIQELYYNIYI